MQPSVFITTSASSEAVRRELGRVTEGHEVHEGACAVRMVKSATMALDLSRQLLTAVCLGDGGEASGAPALLGSFLNAGEPLQVRAAGGLLHWLLKSRIISEADAAAGGAAALPGGLRLFSLADMLQMSSETLRALSIFVGEPSGGGKEGFSLCALLDRTVSPPGGRLLRTWLLQPSRDIELLRHRHDAVAFAMAARAQAPELWREIKTCLRKSRDMTRVLSRIRSVAAVARDWFALAGTIQSACLVREKLLLLLRHVRMEGGGEPPGDPLSLATPYSAASPFLLRSVVREFTPELAFLATTLDSIIDWSGSKDASARGRLAVNAGLDARLDECRRTYADLPAFLADVSQAELERHPSLRSVSYKYIAQIGIVAEVDKAENGLAPATVDARRYGGDATTVIPMVDSARAAAVLPEGWILCFESSGALLMKSPRARELDAYFGDLSGVIADVEAAIVRQLEDKVLEFEVLLHTVGQRLAEVDVLMSFAEVSLDFSYCRPTIVPQPVLLVKAARHPLQELCVDAFVPNDISLAPGMRENGGALAIITGPNASGKSGRWGRKPSMSCARSTMHATHPHAPLPFSPRSAYRSLPQVHRADRVHGHGRLLRAGAVGGGGPRGQDLRAHPVHRERQRACERIQPRPQPDLSHAAPRDAAQPAAAR